MATARARMLSWTISKDGRVARLSCPYAKLLYTWMIAHGDPKGRLNGEPHEVRSTVMPREAGVTDADVEAWLGEMHDVGLIVWFAFDGMRYVQLSGWDKHQRLTGNMRRSSDLPDPPDELMADASRKACWPNEVGQRIDVAHTADRRRAHSGQTTFSESTS